MFYGFTGSRHGMSQRQAKTLDEYLRSLLGTPKAATEWHHGCCVGADAQSHYFAWNVFRDGCTLVIHPPTNKKWMQQGLKGEYREPQSYRVRNRNIVDSVQFLIATPRSMVDQSGGTWDTINYARKVDVETLILTP